MNNARETRRAVIEALHRSRLQPYLDACRQNERDALQLYRWNLQLTAALQEILSVTEVVLRNAIDRQLRTWNADQLGCERSWLLAEPGAPLRSLISRKRKQAIGAASKALLARAPTHPRHGLTPTHDDVLAQVMFGMWKDLLPNHSPNAGSTTENMNREFMWSQAIVKAFPNVPDLTGEDTYWKVSRLHHLRNRVAHMETLIGLDAASLTKDALTLVRAIDVHTHDWLSGMNRVPVVAKARPPCRTDERFSEAGR
ncbi:hypothetical protein ACEXOS_002405 [Herbiconiux sp. P16]|uniref:hypothetical protein n=1 Tax=Herbiconiux wuyangfengii TaxID=3342794 RepID=UPI0035BB21F7